MGAGNTVDAPTGTPGDAAAGTPDAFVQPPGSILVSGTALVLNTNGTSTATAGVTVAAFANTDENTAVATATSDAQGKYTLVITPNGAALDGFIKATKTGLVDTYLYPPAPLSANFAGADSNMVSTQTYNLLAIVTGQKTGMGIIALEVEDATAKFVAGVAVTSTPAPSTVDYTGSGGLPAAGTATAADGRAYLINVPPSTVTNPTMVMAQKTGSTFATHSLKVRADVLTTTLIVP